MSAGLEHLERARAELGRFDPEIPLEEAWTPPASWYVDEAFAELERATVFARSWQLACALDELPEPGSFVRVDLLGRSYVVLRDAEGRLRGFHNVCLHHAGELVAGPGRASELVCPYHGWTYDLDGRLRSAPRMAGVRCFERERLSLAEVAVETLGPFVFLHPGEGKPARSPAEELAPLPELVAGWKWDELGELVWVARRRYELRCNWKVFVDNYLDGGYHVPVLHTKLAGHLDLSTYRTRLDGRVVAQTCSERGADGGGERLGGGAVYAWLFPNLMLNRYGPVLDTNRVTPLAPDRCEVVFDFWFEPDQAGDGELVDRCLAESEGVQAEDVGICEAVQRGLASPAYDRGRYAPRVEHGMHGFHRMLASELSEAEPGALPAGPEGPS